ncbi:MAG: hypothetical protein ACK4ZW_05900 [Blastomonas sp.]
MAFSGSLRITLQALLSGAADIGSRQQDINYTISRPIGSGTGDNQADQVFADTRTLAASSSEDLDMAGVLTNGLGSTITFASVKALIIVAAAGNTNDVVVGGAASNAFATMFGDATDTIKVPPGGFVVLGDFGATGFAVTASTGDLLKIANGGSGTPVSYDILIVGDTA